MTMRVAVVGASGYAGGELLRLISGHPDLDLVMATADSNAGKSVADVHANLAGLPSLANLIFEPHAAAKGAAADLFFLALPAGQSAPMAASIADDAAIVDLGPDFRLADPAAWSKHYGGEHAGRWVTGLPELPGIRADIQNATQIAAPGCYATAAILALAPLASARLISCDDVVVVAASGTSGAGRSLRADLLGSEVMGSVSAYQAGGTHRHTAEIEQALAALAWGSGWSSPVDNAAGVARVSFTPMLAPMPRGILATCTARLAAPGTDTAAVRTALADAYAQEPFVCLLPEGTWPRTGAVVGSNGAQVQAAADPHSGRVTVVAAIDNLGKGAAGQAIQNANLVLGLPESAGLLPIGVAP
ncbi:MAG: N-acetyl-gamma-glutamyl-phosphate reductase [Streptosporangiaceae bacterium]